MIDQIQAEQLDDAIDRFEDSWSVHSVSTIGELLEEYGLGDDPDALVELVRIDIELRYEHELPVNLEAYLRDFSGLQGREQHIGRMAFEDYRSRQRHSHSIDVDRWRQLPGIRNELWYQRLLVEASNTTPDSFLGPMPPSLDSGVDLAFESALADAGFRLVQEIGQGALGRVYLATQKDLADRYVVLKVVSRAMSEPQNMALLQHTNIVPIYSFIQVLSRSVICMPYAGRLTLADYLNSKSNSAERAGESLVATVRERVESTKIASIGSDQEKVPAASRLVLGMSPAADERAVLKPLDELKTLDNNRLATWMFKRLASGLAHAHARDVLHNDLKPGNVLIRNDGEPALLDFNLSQSLSQTASVQAGGTLPYMSPETYRMLMGRTATSLPTSDIYSMGVMMFEFVTGRLPYCVPASAASIDLEPAIQDRRQLPAWQNDENVSPGLQRIINRCLAFSPDDRYQSADQLQTDLQCEHDRLPLKFATEPRRLRFKKWMRRHPVLTSAGPVATALIACVAALSLASAALVGHANHNQAVQDFQEFALDSEHTFARLLADNKRREDASIRDGLSTLEKHGIADPLVFGTLLSDRNTDEQNRRVRDTALRHIVQLGLLESERLTQLSMVKPLQPNNLQRLDHLTDLAERVNGVSQSRACTFLRSALAKFADDPESHHALLAEANAISPSTDSERFMEAMRLMLRSNYHGAAELLTGLADKDAVPSGLRWLALATSQYNIERYEDASVSYTQAVDRYPDLAALRVLRGINFMKEKQGDRAIAEFDRAIEIDPDNLRAWINRGTVRLGRRRFISAIDDFSQALAISPGHVQSLLMRGRAYRSIGRNQAAKLDLNQAMVSDNTDVSSLRARSLSRRDDDPEGALRDLQLADKLRPNDPVTYSRIAKILSDRLDRNDEAIQQMRRAVELEPNDERMLVDFAVLLARAGQHKEAEAYLEKGLSSVRNNRSFYQAACAYALNPDRQSQQQAIGYLAKAIHEGYPANNLATDPDLQAIREMPGFIAISRVYHLANLSQRMSP
tara:strand:- start:181075 stop:184158 length:3084 start_codon:yes stop_codon:yes gene_type:complete